MTPEAKVKAAVREWLDALGCVVSTPIGSGYGVSDMCDLIVAVPQPDGPALYLEVEVKAAKRKKLTPRQALKLKRLHNIRAEGVRVDADNLEWFKEYAAGLAKVPMDVATLRCEVLRMDRAKRNRKIRSRSD